MELAFGGVGADGITDLGAAPGSGSDAASGPAGGTRPTVVRELVARNLRRLRLDGSAGPDDIARAARGFGLDWTAPWVSAVERGQRQLTAEQLVALPFVLTDVLGHRVGLADLLLGEEPVLLARTATARQAPLSPTYLREVLTAAPYRRHFAAPGLGVDSAPPAQSATQRAAAKMREIGRAGLGDVDVRALARAEAGAGELEERLARRLGVAPIVVIAAAAGLWGRSLTEEREERLSPDPYAPPGTSGPRPAAVMRRLTAEVTARLARGEEAVRRSELAAAGETTGPAAEPAEATGPAAEPAEATGPAEEPAGAAAAEPAAERAEEPDRAAPPGVAQVPAQRRPAEPERAPL